MVDLRSIFSSLLIYIFYNEHDHFCNKSRPLFKFIMIKRIFPDDFESCGRGMDTFLRGFSWREFGRRTQNTVNDVRAKIKNMGIH